MFKIKSRTVLFNLLFIMVFIGVISNRLGGGVAYGLILLFLMFLALFKLKKIEHSLVILLYPFLCIMILFCSYAYNIIYYDFNNLYFIQFFGSQVLFFYLLLFFVDVERFTIKSISKFIVWALMLMCAFVIIDYTLISLGMVTKQLSYNTDLAKSYLSQPLGLFRQFSINSTYIVVFYLLYLHFKNTSSNVPLFLLVTISIVLQGSGTGFVLYFMMLFTMFHHFFFFRYFVSFILMSIFVFLIANNIVDKISLDYLIFTYDYFYSIVYMHYFENIHSIYDFLFGIDGNYHLPIDFGPIFMIGKVGFLYFLIYFIAIFYFIFKASDRFLSMALFCLVIGNLHYPALFYPIMNIMLPLLAIYVLNNNKRKKIEKITFNS